jgi:hypothetical protein
MARVYHHSAFSVLSVACTLACTPTRSTVPASPDGTGEVFRTVEPADDGSSIDLSSRPSRLSSGPDSAPDDGGPPLTRDEIRLVVRAKMPQVRACFDAGLARAPDIGGRVVLRFTIGPDGRASSIAVDEDELAEPMVAECLCDELRSWQFPRPRAGVPITIAYPFVFSSAESLRAAGLPRVEGTVKPAAVGAVFEARRTELDDCISEDATGTIGLAFDIDDGGAITRISSYESTLDERARACVLRTVASWTFPPAASGDEARVNHDLRW